LFLWLMSKRLWLLVHECRGFHRHGVKERARLLRILERSVAKLGWGGNEMKGMRRSLHSAVPNGGRLGSGQRERPPREPTPSHQSFLRYSITAIRSSSLSLSPNGCPVLPRPACVVS